MTPVHTHTTQISLVCGEGSRTVTLQIHFCVNLAIREITLGRFDFISDYYAIPPPLNKELKKRDFYFTHLKALDI